MNQLPSNPTESTRRRNPHLWKITPIYGSTDITYEKVKSLDKPQRRIRQSHKPLMNKLESEWNTELLARFTVVYPQALRFMLGNGIWYKPDFVAFPVGLESMDYRPRAFEVKGPHAFRGGLENLKVAATMYRQIKWTLVWKEDGQWKEQLVLP